MAKCFVRGGGGKTKFPTGSEIIRSAAGANEVQVLFDVDLSKQYYIAVAGRSGNDDWSILNASLWYYNGMGQVSKHRDSAGGAATNHCWVSDRQLGAKVARTGSGGTIYVSMKAILIPLE